MSIRRYFGYWLYASVIGLAGASAAATAEGAAQEDPDWPCEQALVPEVSAAVVWDGPPADAFPQDWRHDPGVLALVERITQIQANEAQAQQAVQAFASALEPGDKDRMLTLAFAGVLETLNHDRRTLISGIKRYSRDQTRRAEALGKELDAMVRLEQDASESGQQQIDALKKRLELEQRIFDEREKTIPYLCMRPVSVEQRLGFLARTLAGYLD
jgi:hypothetical protein